MKAAFVLLILGGSLGCGGDSGTSNLPVKSEDLSALRGHGVICGSDAACGGETLLCATDGFCVECRSDADCDAGDVCGTRGFCGDCSSDADCGKKVCDPVLALCADCLSDADCTDKVCFLGKCENPCPTDCGAKVCHPIINACVDCASDSDCTVDNNKPYCADFKCAECIVNRHCPAGEICKPGLNCDVP